MVLAGDLAAKQALASGNAESIPAGATTEIPIKGIRKVIAERMRWHCEYRAINPEQLGSSERFIEVARKSEETARSPGPAKNQCERSGIICGKPRAATSSGHERPFLGDKIVQHSDVHLGVAVDTERGLMVPVIPHAHLRSVADISGQVKSLAADCQAGAIAPDKLSGSTFTVTNLGAMGVTHFTPVLNVPEVAILGVGGVELRPVKGADGNVQFVEHMALSLTIDHQGLDGAPAARFLQDLANAIANIDLLLAQ